MSKHIYRSCSEPIRENPSFNERWRGPDEGLITCWEVGRKKSEEYPELAERTRNGELPKLGWKGGVDKKNKQGKFGTLNYLAQWQGLRGEDLDIDLIAGRIITCSKTQTRVFFTNDQSKFA